jgi:hypothetical protein
VVAGHLPGVRPCAPGGTCAGAELDSTLLRVEPAFAAMPLVVINRPLLLSVPWRVQSTECSWCCVGRGEDGGAGVWPVRRGMLCRRGLGFWTAPEQGCQQSCEQHGHWYI